MSIGDWVAVIIGIICVIGGAWLFYWVYRNEETWG